MRQYTLLDASREYFNIFGLGYNITEVPKNMTWAKLRNIISSDMMHQLKRYDFERAKKLNTLLSKCPFRKNPY